MLRQVIVMGFEPAVERLLEGRSPNSRCRACAPNSPKPRPKCNAKSFMCAFPGRTRRAGRRARRTGVHVGRPRRARATRKEELFIEQIKVLIYPSQRLSARWVLAVLTTGPGAGEDQLGTGSHIARHPRAYINGDRVRLMSANAGCVDGDSRGTQNQSYVAFYLSPASAAVSALTHRKDQPGKIILVIDRAPRTKCSKPGRRSRRALGSALGEAAAARVFSCRKST